MKHVRCWQPYYWS